MNQSVKLLLKIIPLKLSYMRRFYTKLIKNEQKTKQDPRPGHQTWQHGAPRALQSIPRLELGVINTS